MPDLTKTQKNELWRTLAGPCRVHPDPAFQASASLARRRSSGVLSGSLELTGSGSVTQTPTRPEQPRSQEQRGSGRNAVADLFQGRSPILRRLAAAASACRSSARGPLDSSLSALRSLLWEILAGKGWLQLQPSLGSSGKKIAVDNDRDLSDRPTSPLL